jgi:outer membrane protein TolC
MMYIMKPFILPILFFMGSVMPFQGIAQDQLRRYIDQGLAGNLVIQQKNISLQRSMLALKEAKSWFWPSAELLGDYAWAEGGRTIDLPIGDLLNPVYSTLNTITGGQNFPMVENQEFQLMPRNFYDARIRLAYPLLNPGIIYQSRIREQQVTLSQLEIETYRSELTSEIETAYYRYCLATDAVQIYQSAMELVSRNLKINESLQRNGKGLAANVLRAQSELENVRARVKEAENQVKNAKYWFNFLLNRPFSDTIYYEILPVPPDLSVKLQTTPDISGRSELKSLKTLEGIRNLSLALDQRYLIPRVNLFADFGSQASDWEFSQKSRYVLAGVQLSMPIFSGQRNRLAIADTRLEINDLSIQQEQTVRQFTVAAGVARNNLGTAAANLVSAEKQYESAISYFKLIEKGYSEGINSLIEFMDARNQLTTSEIQVRLNRYKLLEAYAELERQTRR